MRRSRRIRGRKIIDTIQLAKAWQLMVGTVGCKIVWLPEGDNQPRTNMKTKEVYLPKPQPEWTDEQVSLHTGEGWHEVGHHHESQTRLLELMEEGDIGFGSKLGLCINAVDDVWQEMISSDNYLGAAQSLSYLQGYHCKRGAGLLEKEEEIVPFIAELCGLMYSSRASWQPDVARAWPEYSKHIDISKWDHLIDRLTAITDHPDPAKEVIDIAKEICIAEGDDPEDESVKGSSDKGEEEGREEEKGGEGKSESSDEEGDAGVDSLVSSYKDLMGHTHTEEGADGEGGGEIIYDHDLSDYTPYTPDKFKTEPPPVGWPAISSRGVERVYEETAKVGAKLARIFQTAAQDGISFQNKRGKLTPKHLTRGTLGDPRIFQRKIARIDTTADIYFLCDCSGSMAGPRFNSMVAAIGQLSYALQIANVNHKIVGFTETYDMPYNITIKDWDKPSTWEEIKKKFCKISLMQNADGDSLMYAFNDIKQRDTNRKIIIVLSDGSPCCDNPGDAYSYLKSVTTYIEKTNVELYGIGIETEAVKSYYTDYTVLEDSSEIETCLEKVVRTKIIK